MSEFFSLEGDTIAAIASAPGRGGIGIIRVSGPAASKIAATICRIQLQPRYAHYCSFHDNDGAEPIDRGISLFFPAPNSFTGEDVVELQAHGGPIVLDLLLSACCRSGARQARPGEFSERAFLNNKIDLAQAEAIADLINSTTESAARSANRSLQGEFSLVVNALSASTMELRVYVEAAIDFPEEEIDFLADGMVAQRLNGIIEQLEAVQEVARQGSLLREGMKLVIAGKPNAGKSSLLNALTGQDSAIVTAIEGTTRDVLREHIELDGLPVHIVDTAGLRTGKDLVEQEGIRRAWQEIETADRILLVVDSSNKQDFEAQNGALGPEIKEMLNTTVAVTTIHNKCDLIDLAPSIKTSDSGDVITLSAKNGEGIGLLRDHLKEVVGFKAAQTSLFSARRRHLEALQEALDALTRGASQLQASGAGELLAEDLRAAAQQLGEITGVVSSDELLGSIFSSFCIGK